MEILGVNVPLWHLRHPLASYRIWRRQRAAVRARKTVVNRWSERPEDNPHFAASTYWLGLAPVMQHYVARATVGSECRWGWADCLVHECFAGRLPVPRMLSLGCGSGGLERDLARMGAFVRCDAVDLSPVAVQSARETAAAEGLVGLHYATGDLNHLRLPADTYDAVWFNGSLHHVEALEGLLEQVRTCLRPDGYLLLNEYVGADHFDLPGRQREAISAAFALIPERYRRLLWRGREIPAREPLLPDPEEVRAADPSEAVRSSEIMRVVRERFEVVRCCPAGGTVLQFLLHGISVSFRDDDPDARRVLEMLFDIEDTLVDTGELPSDFVVVSARPRPAGVALPAGPGPAKPTAAG